jgi:hypothetical protein
LERGLFFFLGEIGEEEGKEEILKERGRRRKLEEQIVLGNFYRDTVVAGNFGLGGQETARIPGARESERLFLVGWEVNIQFGQFGKEQEQVNQGLNQPTCRSRYVFY